MNQLLARTLFGITIFGLAACGLYEDDDAPAHETAAPQEWACEVYGADTNPNNGADIPLYGCAPKTQHRCNADGISSLEVVDTHFHDQKSCNDIGYTKTYALKSSLSGATLLIASGEGAEPSPSGYFIDHPPSSSTADSTSTGSDAKCTDTYQGPEFDPQADTFCKSAWNYLCSANDAVKAEADCKYYRQMQLDNPSMPACPYC